MILKKMLQNGNMKKIVAESWSVSWAMTLIMFFIFLIGIADVYIAGRFGKEVQAAYGMSFQLYFVFLVIAMALSVGAVSVISRTFAGHDKRELRVAISSSLTMILAAGLVFSAIGVLLTGSIIRALRAPEEIKSFAVTFVGIYSTGIIFHYIMMNTNAILRACNMVRKSLLTMAMVCCLNIGLNFYLSFYTPLGFRGIAVSTVISLLAGSVLNLYYVLRFNCGFSKASFSIIKRITNISWPAGVLQVFWQFGSMVLFMILSRLPRHNVEIMAAFTNGLKIESAIFLPAFAFNMANAVVVGNLLGKRREEDAFHGGIMTAAIGVVIVSVVTAVVMLNARAVASALSDNPIVIDRCVQYILITLCFEPFMAWGIILAGGLNGAGDTRSVMTIVSLSIWVLRVPLSFVLGVLFGYGALAVWWSMNVSILVQTYFISRRYFSKRWIAVAHQ
ncbi:MAG: MATE family efflux transporter [Candidatus Omnitrophota bacterium]